MNSGRLVIIGMLIIIGMMLLGPNAGALYHYFSANRAEQVEAHWTGSRTVHNAKDTVGLPTFSFTRKIGPMPQDCAVELVQYVHAPDGKPKYERLTLIAGKTCDDLAILSDPPRERMILAAFGAMFVIGGLFMFYSQRRQA